jgi:hypothetical protein
LDVSPSFPETGSVPLVSLWVVSVPGCTVSLVVAVVVLSPQTALEAEFARLVMVSMVVDMCMM